MLQPIFDFIEKLASDFSWRRVVIIICLMFIASLFWFGYEALTATNQLAKYERSVAILEKLESLTLSDSNSQKISNNIYQGLDSITKTNQYQLSLIYELSLEARQAILSILPWFLFTLFYIPSAFRGDIESRNSIFALVFIGLLMGSIGYFVPTKWGVWAYPIVGNFLILIIIAWFGNRMKSK